MSSKNHEANLYGHYKFADHLALIGHLISYAKWVQRKKKVQITHIYLVTLKANVYNYTQYGI